MTFLSYARRIHGRTAFVHGGKALDMDLGGGLEQVLEGLIEQGAKRIVLTLGDMKFLHFTLFATLLSVQRLLQEKGGDLILAEVPWFVQMRFHQLGVANRFPVVPHAGVVERAERLTVNLNLPNPIIPG
jgi:anti-anti-sigma regulatory factor